MDAAREQLGHGTSVESDIIGKLVYERCVAIGREASVVVVAHYFAIWTEIVEARETKAASVTSVNRRLTRNSIADLYLVVGLLSPLYNDTAEFVTHDYRGPYAIFDGVVQDVGIGSADTSGLDADLYLIVVWLRLIDLAVIDKSVASIVLYYPSQLKSPLQGQCKSAGGCIYGILCLFNFLHTTDDSTLEPDLDAVGMKRGLGQYIQDDPGR